MLSAFWYMRLYRVRKSPLQVLVPHIPLISKTKDGKRFYCVGGSDENQELILDVENEHEPRYKSNPFLKGHLALS